MRVVIGHIECAHSIKSMVYFEKGVEHPEKRHFQNGRHRVNPKMLTLAILGLGTRIIPQMKAIDAHNKNMTLNNQ